MRATRLMLVPALLMAAGCMKGQRTIKVNADGSGTIVDTVSMGEEAKSMKAAMEQMDQSPAADKKAKSQEKLKSRAASMGEGVAFVSNETAKDGTEKTVWSFKDISRLKLDPMPFVSDGESSSKEEPLTFRFAKSGGGSVLTVVFPKEKPAASTEAKPAPKPEEEAQAIAMMKGMLAGLKMTSQLEVNGRVVKTNSPYAAGSTVTLMEIDFDQIDEAGLKKLQLSGKSQPPAAVLKSIKGLKFSEGEVAVEFAAK
jgi:hypothetical protein